MKVAVIGAGFSGMLAAYLLEKEGINVTVYEKLTTIGGHCRTLTSKNNYTELGTLFSFTSQLKPLLIDLKVAYTERFPSRNFVDENFKSVAHLSNSDITLLVDELKQLEGILAPYQAYLSDINYGYIPEALMLPLRDFLNSHGLNTVCQVLAPYLSSYGFGNIFNVQAYYAFKAFDVTTINTIIKGKKLLYLNKGVSELIQQLGQNISDIRYGLEVINVEVIGSMAKVETPYGHDTFDQVLITTKLPRNVIKDDLYNRLMKQIDTKPYISCAYEINNKHLATTYYKANLGKESKLQFFYTTRQNSKTMLVAYAYGTVNKDLINGITWELEQAGVDLNHLITVNQWHIFPHLKPNNLTTTFYRDIIDRQKTSQIRLIGTLISIPSIANLYLSVSDSVKEIVQSHRGL